MTNIYGRKKKKDEERQHPTQPTTNAGGVFKFPEEQLGVWSYNMMIHYKTKAPKSQSNPTPSPRSDKTIITTIKCIKALEGHKDKMITKLGVPLGPVELSDKYVARMGFFLEQYYPIPKSRVVYAYAMKRLLVGNGVTDILVPIPEYYNAPADYYEPEEVKRLLTAAQSETCECIIAFLYYTGVRVGELREYIKMSNLDIEGKKLTVVTGKKHMKIREVPLPTPLLPYLEKWLRIRAEGVRALREQGRPVPDQLFFNSRGKMFSESSLFEMLELASRRAGLLREKRKKNPDDPNEQVEYVGNCHCHRLRHTHAIMLKRSGCPIDEASRRMGNTVSVLEITYRHGNFDDSKRYQDMIEKNWETEEKKTEGVES